MRRPGRTLCGTPPVAFCGAEVAIFGRRLPYSGLVLQGRRGGPKPPGSGWIKLYLLEDVDPRRWASCLPPQSFHEVRSAGCTGGYVSTRRRASPLARDAVYVGAGLSGWMRGLLGAPDDPLRVGEHIWVRIAL